MPILIDENESLEITDAKGEALLLLGYAYRHGGTLHRTALSYSRHGLDVNDALGLFWTVTRTLTYTLRVDEYPTREAARDAVASGDAGGDDDADSIETEVAPAVASSERRAQRLATEFNLRGGMGMTPEEFTALLTIHDVDASTTPILDDVLLERPFAVCRRAGGTWAVSDDAALYDAVRARRASVRYSGLRELLRGLRDSALSGISDAGIDTIVAAIALEHGDDADESALAGTLRSVTQLLTDAANVYATE
jgi:hypothetical protein